jgi:hypothetical protein
MRNQSARRRSGRNIAVLSAICSALYGLVVQAQEPSPAEPTNEKSVADIVNEARARVEAADKRPHSDWQGYKREQHEEQQAEESEESKPRSWYVGFGFENRASVSLSEPYRIRESQIQATSLEYLQPNIAYENIGTSGMSLFFGRELNDWLDVEVSSHGMETFYQVLSDTHVARTTMTPESPRDTVAGQGTSFYERTYSLSLMPRWNIHRYVALYGRFGIGYNDSRLDSGLDISAEVPGPPYCTKDHNGIETCKETTVRETRDLDVRHYQKNDFFPIVGVGVRLFGAVRMEFIYRSNVTIGESSDDISAPYVSFCWRTEWHN